MKNGLNFFFCKYYLPHKCPQLEGDLLSDYIDFPNFREYCMRHSEVMSLHTKIYFSFVISQSLRYLKQYKIVHLDLKPSNIMISQRLMIKLIDFGESFHPDLVSTFQSIQIIYLVSPCLTVRLRIILKSSILPTKTMFSLQELSCMSCFLVRTLSSSTEHNSGNKCIIKETFSIISIFALNSASWQVNISYFP